MGHRPSWGEHLGSFWKVPLKFRMGEDEKEGSWHRVGGRLV